MTPEIDEWKARAEEAESRLARIASLFADNPRQTHNRAQWVEEYQLDAPEDGRT